MHNKNNNISDFYSLGPNSSLIILGFTIDNYTKYIVVVSYCFINSILRSLFHNILTPWVTNSVQDITKVKPKNMHMFAYESAFVITMYTWFDWFLYYNILASQMDLFMIEISMDIIMAVTITYYYVTYDVVIKENNKSEFDFLL